MERLRTSHKRTPLYLNKGRDSKYKGSGRGTEKYTLCSKEQQAIWFKERSESILKDFEKLKITDENGLHGDDLGKVLVLEFLDDSLKDLIKAFNKIEGCEYLAELIEANRTIPDYLAYHDKKSKKIAESKSKAFCVFYTENGFKQFLQLWRKYQKGEKFLKGYTKFRDAFKYLLDIRVWSEEDRIENKKQIQDWILQSETGSHWDEEDFLLEIELWFHKDIRKRTESEKKLKEVIEINNGKLLDSFVFEEIGYHGLKASVKKEFILKLKEDDFTEIQLLQTDSIMFINPVPQGISIRQNSDNYLESNTSHQPQRKEAYAAILDGMPLQNHNDIRNFISVLDVFELESKCPVDERVHGTAVSSIIINGTYKDYERVNSKIAHCPIMVPVDGRERIPNDKLFIRLVHEAIEELFNNRDPIRIINFSLGDSHRPYLTRRISPLAKMIDFLSFKYKVLFLISAGNSPVLNLDCDREEFINFSEEEKFKVILSAKKKNINDLKIISPAESVNSLCIGATEYDDCDIERKISDRENGILYRNDKYCAAYSRVGLGIKNSIKPELLFPGGSSVYKRLFFNSRLEIDDFPSNRFGLRHAFAGKFGDLNKQARGCGTSYATALATNNAIRIYEQLLENNWLPVDVLPNKEFDALLVKNLLLHSSWHDPDFSKFIEDNDSCKNFDGNFQKPRRLARFHGYGKTDFERSINAFDHSVLFIACNKIPAATRHEYEIPLPKQFNTESLSNNIRLISTLVWFTDINPESNKYQKNKLDIEIDKDSCFEEQISSSQPGGVMSNTNKHSIFERKKGKTIVPINSSNSLAKISVCCQRGDDEIDSLAYVLAITLEIDSSIDIYTEIYSQIQSVIANKT
jgi:hypothetical protein